MGARNSALVKELIEESTYILRATSRETYESTLAKKLSSNQELLDLKKQHRQMLEEIKQQRDLSIQQINQIERLKLQLEKQNQNFLEMHQHPFQGIAKKLKAAANKKAES